MKKKKQEQKIGVRFFIKKQIPEVVKDTIRFNSFPPILMFAASCSHRTPRTNAKPRAMALAERESAKLPTTGKTKRSKTWVFFFSVTTYYIKMGKVTVSSNLNWDSSKKENLHW